MQKFDGQRISMFGHTQYKIEKGLFFARSEVLLFCRLVYS